LDEEITDVMEICISRPQSGHMRVKAPSSSEPWKRKMVRLEAVVSNEVVVLLNPVRNEGIIR